MAQDKTHAFTYFADAAELVTSIPPDAIVSRTVVKEGDLQVIVFGFAPGQELSEHTSAKTAVMHFVRGAAQLVVDGEPARAQPGTVVAMRPHTPHSVLAEEETVMLLYMFGGR
jgi:quercetin dioxygenase-like cupin family protein